MEEFNIDYSNIVYFFGKVHIKITNNQKSQKTYLDIVQKIASECQSISEVISKYKEIQTTQQQLEFNETPVQFLQQFGKDLAQSFNKLGQGLIQIEKDAEVQRKLIQARYQPYYDKFDKKHKEVLKYRQNVKDQEEKIRQLIPEYRHADPGRSKEAGKMIEQVEKYLRKEVDKANKSERELDDIAAGQAKELQAIDKQRLDLMFTTQVRVTGVLWSYQQQIAANIEQMSQFTQAQNINTLASNFYSQYINNGRNSFVETQYNDIKNEPVINSGEQRKMPANNSQQINKYDDFQVPGANNNLFDNILNQQVQQLPKPFGVEQIEKEGIQHIFGNTAPKPALLDVPKPGIGFANINPSLGKNQKTTSFNNQPNKSQIQLTFQQPVQQNTQPAQINTEQLKMDQVIISKPVIRGSNYKKDEIQQYQQQQIDQSKPQLANNQQNSNQMHNKYDNYENQQSQENYNYQYNNQQDQQYNDYQSSSYNQCDYYSQQYDKNTNQENNYNNNQYDYNSNNNNGSGNDQNGW